MMASKKNVPPRVRTTPLSIFVASPFGDVGSHGKVKNNSPGTALRAQSSVNRNGSGKTTPIMKSSASCQSQKRQPTPRSGLTARSHSTPSLVDEVRNERGTTKLSVSGSARRGRLDSAQLRSGGAPCRKKLVMSTSLKNYHSETSLNTLPTTPVSFNREGLKRSTSKVDLCETSCEETSKLIVGVRVRPLSTTERANPSVSNVVMVQGNEVVVSGDQARGQFVYDHCFWSCDPKHSQFATQEDVFTIIVRPLIDKVFEGYNACLFAYGQTGSGKSYSMMGENLESLESLSHEAGVIPRFCHELFSRITQKGGEAEGKLEKSWKVEMTYYEVYNEKIHDLLDECDAASKKCLRVREHPSLGPYVEDLAIKEVHSLAEVLGWLNIGNKQRFTASTEMNEKSSRSHSIFSLTLTQTQVELVMGESMINTRSSRCNLVDLAGSERVAQTCSSGERRKEGVSINQSLLTLGKVISALAEGGSCRKSFAPYRESVLTFLLKESLGGNSRTVMLATISPASTHIDETIATLRYACQARKIVNRVRVNEVPQISVIRTLTADVARLNALREEYEIHMKACQTGPEQQGVREELEILRQEYDEHLSHCSPPQGACTRAECAEVRQRCEQEVMECRLRQSEELEQLRNEKVQLKVELERLRQQDSSGQPGLDEQTKELSLLRKEYEEHLRSCQLDAGPQLQELRAELQRTTTQLSALKSQGDEAEDLRRQCKEWQDRFAELTEKNKLQEKELCEHRLQHVKEMSYLGSEIEAYSAQLKTVRSRIDNLPQFESQPLPTCEYDASLDVYRANLLKKLTSALYEDTTSPNACEFNLSSEDMLPLQLHFSKDTINEADISAHLNSTSGRLSTGTDDSCDTMDRTQSSFISQSSSSGGNVEESVEEILYYLQDKSSRLRELCPGEEAAAVIAAYDQAVSELREVIQGSSLWELSQHFSPPSPSVTPAKSSLRSPAAPRVATPKFVTFHLEVDSDN